MWKPFAFGLIAGAIGLMYIYMKSLPKPSCEEVVADGAIGYVMRIIEEEENSERYTLSEEEYEKMLSLTRYSIYSQNGFATAKWN